MTKPSSLNYRENMRNIHIRWLINRDLAEICEFMKTDASVYSEVFKGRNIIGLVGETCEKIICLCIYEINGTTINLLHLGVHPKFRRQKVATQMLDRVKCKLTDGHKFVNGRTFFKVMVTVRETDLGALNFFKSNGFKGKLVRGHFTDCDAIIMSFVKDGHETPN